ncbi:MAG TPA: DUF4143 domain-containing protein, partial [Fibrobacteria bacterium]|nr:DUF4143 domain-containing protein [Fibrobacteria bacterium]
PWFENFGKRLVKTPKLYLTDTGLLCWLLRIESAEQLAIHAQRGAIFENWVVMESLKRLRNRGAEANLYFWRDQAGHEIDLLEVEGDRFHAMEVKSGATVPKDAFKGLKYFQELSGDRLSRSTLIHGGEGSYEQSGTQVRTWKDVATSDLPR